MTIYSSTNFNATAAPYPDLSVVVAAPTTILLAGVASNIVGLVGTASWGPVGSPQPVSDYSGQIRTFGQLNARKYDLGTYSAICEQQGANNQRNVRVTDGTDTAASAVIGDAALFAAIYSGSAGNKLSVAFAPGSKPNTWRVTVSIAGLGILAETYNNIAGTGAAFWQNLAAAINNGQTNVRSASVLVVVSALGGTAAPIAGTYSLSGGTDGADGVTAAMLLGTDATPRTGMYALRGTGAQVVSLADCDDTTIWTDQASFGEGEGAYVPIVGPSGQSVTQAVAAKAAAGIDTYAAKIMLGDWVYWNDPVTKLSRLVSPAAFVTGLLGALSPQQSTLNKRIQNVVGTQRSVAGSPYSAAELTELATAGIDVICNPVPGGDYFGCRIGHNASSNAVINGDSYTRMTNYIGATLNKGMGKFVGDTITDDELRQCKATEDAFFQAMLDANMIDSFLTVCSRSNNPQDRTALGYLQVDAQVVYLGIAENLICNVEGGASVKITRTATTAS